MRASDCTRILSDSASLCVRQDISIVFKGPIKLTHICIDIYVYTPLKGLRGFCFFFLLSQSTVNTIGLETVCVCLCIACTGSGEVVISLLPR